MATLPTKKSITEELAGMHRAMDRIWDRYSGEFFPSTFEQEWFPPLNLADTGDCLVAEIEIPGVRPRDIDISITEDRLTISGEKKQKKEEEKLDYHIIERRYAKFSRSIQLPSSINPDQVATYYKDGVLRITMGKKEKAKATRIKVKAA
jgi:HSP20 family protein